MSDVREAKAEFRARAAALRDALPAEERAAANRVICEQVLALPEWRRARIVFLYVSFRSEVDTRALLAEGLASGKQVLAPRVDKAAGEIEACPIRSLADLVPGTWGILEPAPSIPAADPTAIDLVLLPGLAFDERGGRLGYGAGYYDRYLKRVRPDCARVAVAYEVQRVEKVPTTPADQPIEMVVTDAGVYRADGSR